MMEYATSSKRTQPRKEGNTIHFNGEVFPLGKVNTRLKASPKRLESSNIGVLLKQLQLLELEC